ncbi:MAG: helix-turn-helix domain-containing protein [Bacteroidota bacterium]|uniref:Helix-turn-helix domain-containing protein n=1 Tax=Flagellimonas okinawensis TaxID=3031324 RepID=A0ABT5XIQ3_9FLAO|nr:helix-turn-helix domain-containing protein [[Muricauda] okinawensis]MDF0705767.1 helix-turn-helix domain-containing protein [[Muricauda] okinawensis]MEC8832226.1 helix-turn-helix domain-containing protein [Bacteroidota bacterium]
MDIPQYTLKAYFDQKKSPCLSFNVYDIQDLSIGKDSELHRSDYFQVVLLDDGLVNHRIEHEHVQLKKNHVTVVFPHQVNALEIDENAKGIIIQFDEVLFCSDLLKNELISYNNDLMNKLNHVVLSTEEFSKINAYGVQIFELFQDLTPIKKEQIRFHIKIMLLEIIEAAHQKYQGFQTPGQLDYFARFKTLIESNFKSKRTVSYYTGELQLTPKKLNAICKEKTGKTALNIIHERILTEIKRQLIFSGKNHKEIAYDLGFDSPSALNKFVYAKLKETPSELKEELSRIYKY